MTSPKYMTEQQAAKALGIAPTSLRLAVLATGRLRVKTIGGKRMVLRSDVARAKVRPRYTPNRYSRKPVAVITEAKVWDMLRRWVAGDEMTAIANSVGITKKSLCHIIYGRRWASVTGISRSELRGAGSRPTPAEVEARRAEIAKLIVDRE